MCAVRRYPLHIQPAADATGPIVRIAPAARASMDLGFTSPLNIAMVGFDATFLDKCNHDVCRSVRLIRSLYVSIVNGEDSAKLRGQGGLGLSVHADGGGAAGDLQRLIFR